MIAKPDQRNRLMQKLRGDMCPLPVHRRKRLAISLNLGQHPPSCLGQMAGYSHGRLLMILSSLDSLVQAYTCVPDSRRWLITIKFAVSTNAHFRLRFTFPADLA